MASGFLASLGPGMTVGGYPMDFGFSEEQRLLRETVRKLSDAWESHHERARPA